MKKYEPNPADWGLHIGQSNDLIVNACSVPELALIYGTPLHIVNQTRLYTTAIKFREVFESAYPGPVSVHYAFKCNSLPEVINTVRQAGLEAEVMSEMELELALQMGFTGEEIIVNGPCKTYLFLEKCVRSKVRLIVIDSIAELADLQNICARLEQHCDILFRINPDYIPRGMNKGSATGSRRNCAFGLDFKGGEVEIAFNCLRKFDRLNFRGFHFHIGTGIRHSKDYARALKCLKQLNEICQGQGVTVEIIDIGGGFASATTREFTSGELLLYQGADRLPLPPHPQNASNFEDFAHSIADTLKRIFPSQQLPLLICEPGRSIVSSNQFLLLTVHRIKERSMRKWLITDGGLGTVTMPTYYEYHEIFLCNDLARPRKEKVTIIGPVCFAGDIIYKNKLMPEVHQGEIIAVMDSGAYFLALESSFGFPRPAIVAVDSQQHRLVRRRENFADMFQRDLFWQKDPLFSKNG